MTRLTIEKVAPMVQGLFPLDEQPIVLDMLERCVVFLTSANIESVLRETVWCSTAWTLSNLYLQSVGAPFGSDAPRLVGVSRAGAEIRGCFEAVDAKAERGVEQPGGTGKTRFYVENGIAGTNLANSINARKALSPPV